MDLHSPSPQRHPTAPRAPAIENPDAVPPPDTDAPATGDDAGFDVSETSHRLEQKHSLTRDDPDPELNDLDPVPPAG